MNERFQRVGPQTRDLLAKFGLDSASIAAVERGEIRWDIDPSSVDDGGGYLVLFDSEGVFAPIAQLSKVQADELVNAWEFERRQTDQQDRPSTFPSGSHEDWTGVHPDSDWDSFVHEYERAVGLLAASRSREVIVPYLFLCRHTLELLLKAIIMLGQRSMGLVADLPTHHDLQRLWTAAYPIACHSMNSDLDGHEAVGQVVDDYHAVDPTSFTFRYPVSPRNKAHDHPGYIYSFSNKDHARQFADACAFLNRIVFQLRLYILVRKRPQV